MTSNVKILYKEVICNGDRSLFSYLKDFLALMLQNPVEKSGVMMLFKINRIIFLQIHSSQFIVLANNRLWFLGCPKRYVCGVDIVLVSLRILQRYLSLFFFYA